jgi:hypothetical protein
MKIWIFIQVIKLVFLISYLLARTFLQPPEEKKLVIISISYD